MKTIEYSVIKSLIEMGFQSVAIPHWLKFEDHYSNGTLTVIECMTFAGEMRYTVLFTDSGNVLFDHGTGEEMINYLTNSSLL